VAAATENERLALVDVSSVTAEIQFLKPAAGTSTFGTVTYGDS
jgi:hypothetical protein